ncbi:hypothetical protein Poly59_52220 [Rubripirellula reticaptiva]|uniref:Uncharacterized protein n=2 Tax=Rubripirellula reticaptiva TaxID=2528013 RepID=A0A5C6EIU5_9BACT|nr:hypothetical protein Poly59_52220 [Rubripirellula reticaptiva]
MITSGGLSREPIANMLFAAALLLTLAITMASSTLAAEPQTRTAAKPVMRSSVNQTGQIQTTRVKTNARKRTSIVAQAASGRIPNTIPEAPLDGSLIRGSVKQVGFLEDYVGCQNGCGAVCDCCDAGPTCGMEASCGIEVGCGFEPGCGWENGCGVEGCASCGESSCGVESFMGEPTCGMEINGQCSCNACRGIESIPIFLPLLRVNWCRFQFFAGVQGFTGPMSYANTNAASPNSRSGSSSFGFYEGINEGRSLKKWLGWDMAAQLGFRATQSNLSGSEFSNSQRSQVFVTGGLFRRVDYGLQYGAVFDYMDDDWWFNGNLTQIRGELSWKTKECHSFGFQFMSGLGDDSSKTEVTSSAGALINSTINFEPLDQYRLFYRRLLAGSGDWSAFGGWTDNGDTILGANMNLPLRQKLVLATGVTYLAPAEGDNNLGNREEGWNISMGLVYRPGGPTGCGRYCRPLFDVADNGTFMVEQK